LHYFNRNNEITHLSLQLHMNNAIMATVMIAMMFAIAATTPYVFGPAPAVIFKTTEGDSLTDSTITDVGGRRGR
jgi:hypothetical protein